MMQKKSTVRSRKRHHPREVGPAAGWVQSGKGLAGRRRRFSGKKSTPDFRSGQLRRGTVHARSYARKPKI